MFPMAEFELHPRLLADCHRLGRFRLSHLLLHRNAGLPWLILVPEVSAAVHELFELEAPDRRELVDEIDVVARFVKDSLGAQKINIAAIGNLVPQLHVHVVGRHPGDPCWPGVVWGRLPDGQEWPPQRIIGIVGAISRLRPFERA